MQQRHVALMHGGAKERRPRVRGCMGSNWRLTRLHSVRTFAAFEPRAGRRQTAYVLRRAPKRCFRDAVVLLVGNQTAHVGRQARPKGISVDYSRVSRS